MSASDPEPSLSPSDGLALLSLARATVVATVQGTLARPLDLGAVPARLREPGASFVTLLRSGALRGCLGSLHAERALAEDVRQHSIAVCASDYRFPPVGPDEIQELGVEIAVLGSTRPLVYQNPQELPGRLRPGIDGVLLQAGPRRATFLPKVWERVPSPEEFLGLLCRKAGLDEDLWRRELLEISTYSVEIFQE
ncbi:MAG: AmmeMemoRadiSam system protein A [Anaerolineales bacterium]